VFEAPVDVEDLDARLAPLLSAPQIIPSSSG